MNGMGKQVLVLTVLSALAQMINFSYRVVVARMAGAEIMGLYQLVMSAYGVIQSVTTVGLTAALSNLTARCLAVGDTAGIHRLRSLCLKLFCALMLPIGAVTVICSDALSVHLLGDARTQLGLILLIPCLTLTGVENLHKNIFYGAGRHLPPAVAEVWEQVVRACAVIGLLTIFLPQYPERVVGLILWGMILCEVSSAVTLRTLFGQYFGRNKSRGGSASEVKRVAAIAVPVSLNALLGNLLGAANSALVPRLLMRGGMERGEAVARLGVVCGMTFPMLALPTVYLGALNLVMMPKLARAAALERRGEVGRLVSHGMRTVCGLTLPSMTAMVIFGEVLGQVLYGRRDVGEYILPLGIAMGLGCCTGVLATALNSIGRQKTVAAISLTGGVVRLGCTVALTGLSGMGMGGYAAGVLVGTVLEFMLCLLAADRYAGLRLEIGKWLLAPGLGTALGGLNASLLFRVLQTSGVAVGWTILVCVLLLWGLCALVQWLLQNDEQND